MGSIRDYIAAKADCVSVKDGRYAVAGDGVTDDTAGLQSYIDFCESSGYDLFIPSGTYKITSTLNVNSGSNFTIRGSGKYSTTIKLTAASDVSILSINTVDGLTIEHLGLHGNYSVTGFSSHGIAAVDCNALELRNVYLTDVKNSNILVYASVNDTVDYCRITSCRCDGISASNNGILIVDGRYCFIGETLMQGAPGSPGYGLQLKNDCRYCVVYDSVAEGCQSGFALGQDSGDGAKYNQINGVAYNCYNAFIAGYAIGNRINIVGNACTGQTFRLEYSSHNHIQGSALNAPTNKNVVYIDNAGSDYNCVHLNVVEDGNADTIYFGSGVQNNFVRVGVIDRATPPSTAADMVNDSSGNATNIVVWDME